MRYELLFDVLRISLAENIKRRLIRYENEQSPTNF
jgi:hypothetical protein